MYNIKNKLPSDIWSNNFPIRYLSKVILQMSPVSILTCICINNALFNINCKAQSLYHWQYTIELSFNCSYKNQFNIRL